MTEQLLGSNGEKPAGAVEEDRAYSQAEALAELAVVDLGRTIESALSRLGDPHLIRGRVGRPRIKSATSLRRKASEQGWTFSQALSEARDLIGFRVICNNLQDVLRAREHLTKAFEDSGLKVSSVDYVERPRNGYRAVHLWFPFTIQAGAAQMVLHCEVQIRSRLQDTWAELSHVDFYRGDIPPALKRSMERLSARLHEADKVADRIRSSIAKPRRGRRPEQGAVISDSAIAFLFRHAFGADPPDYLVHSTLREMQGTPIRADGLASILDDKDFLTRLENEYHEANRLEIDADPVQLFRWAVDAAVTGRESALRAAKHDGREAWRETDSIYRREALSDLPKDADELSSYIHDALDDGDPHYDITQWAEALGAAHECACGAKIVDEYAFADAFIKRNRLRGSKADLARKKISSLIINSGVETGDGGLCSYCAYTMDKD